MQSVPGSFGTVLKCPSAQPETPGSAVMGVMGGTGQIPSLTYLDELYPVDADVLALSAPLVPTEIFRFAAACQARECLHFDGVDCRLATRVCERLLPVVDSPPHCAIRSECRWFRQEGIAVCLRCPQIVTLTRRASEKLIQIAGP